MSQFLNRVLALTIARQNTLFEAFETLMAQILEGVRASGGLDCQSAFNLDPLSASNFDPLCLATIRMRMPLYTPLVLSWPDAA